MASVPFSSPLAAELAEGVLERFLRYVRVDTQSEEGASTFPSTAKQLDLSRILADELREIGLDDVELNEFGYVIATLPGTPGAPVIGLIAHVDTTPESPGAGVTPIVHEDYAGEPIVLPGDPSQILDPAEEPALAARVGHDIVTSDGTTLLGADDKAGVAEIMAAVAYLRGTSEPRATVRVAFTVDEEVGRGADHFDVEAFGAEAAYTLDGSGVGEVEIETFSARQLKVHIEGRGEHPGTAKGKLVNAVKLAADFVAALPRDTLSPETTEGREGFVHPSRIVASVEEAVVIVIVRDHDDEEFERHTELVLQLAREIEEREPRARVTVDTWDQYRNMRERDRAASTDRRERRGGDSPRGRRAGAVDHPRRHRRRPPDRDGAADAEPVHRRPEVPLAPRVGERAGHGHARLRWWSSSSGCGANRPELKSWPRPGRGHGEP